MTAPSHDRGRLYGVGPRFPFPGPKYLTTRRVYENLDVAFASDGTYRAKIKVADVRKVSLSTIIGWSTKESDLTDKLVEMLHDKAREKILDGLNEYASDNSRAYKKLKAFDDAFHKMGQPG